MKIKTLIIIILPVTMIASLIGSYFVYMDYSDRQRKKEIKRLIVKMQGEIEQATYKAKTKNTAKIALRVGEKNRSDILYYVDKLGMMPLIKKLSMQEEQEMNDYLKRIPSKYEIKRFFRFEPTKRQVWFKVRKCDTFIKNKMLAEAQSERKAVIKEKLYNIQELKKQYAANAKIIAIKDKYKKIVQKLETE